MKFQVEFTDRRYVTVAVEASSAAEALLLARHSWHEMAEKVEWVEEPAVITAVPQPHPAPVLEAQSC